MFPEKIIVFFFSQPQQIHELSQNHFQATRWWLGKPDHVPRIPVDPSQTAEIQTPALREGLDQSAPSFPQPGVQYISLEVQTFKEAGCEMKSPGKLLPIQLPFGSSVWFPVTDPYRSENRVARFSEQYETSDPEVGGREAHLHWGMSNAQRTHQVYAWYCRENAEEGTQ